jgi:hypothetical protein
VVASNIFENGHDPESAADFCQQQLGLPFTAVTSSITETQWISACNAPSVDTTRYPDSVKVLGVDQGRADWYGVTATFHFNWEKQASENERDFLLHIDSCLCDTAEAVVKYAADWGAEVGLLDNEPSIYLGAELCSRFGYHMADQQKSQKDDFRLGEVRDAGTIYPCWKIRDPKYGFMVLEAFREGRVILPSHFLHYLTDRSIKSPAKHLRSVRWDSGSAEIIKAADDIDHLFFALLFATAGFGIYLNEPGTMACDLSYDWV